MTTSKELKMTTRKCPYCHTFFIPSPRGGGKNQKICKKPSCKKALKAENNARWKWENPDHWHNDYPRVKQWLDQHPGYLKQYRADHPEYVQKNREAQGQRDRKKRIHLDIQDDKTPKPLEVTFLVRSFPCLDIQIQIAKSISLEQN